MRVAGRETKIVLVGRVIPSVLLVRHASGIAQGEVDYCRGRASDGETPTGWCLAWWILRDSVAGAARCAPNRVPTPPDYGGHPTALRDPSPRLLRPWSRPLVTLWDGYGWCRA